MLTLDSINTMNYENKMTIKRRIVSNKKKLLTGFS